MSIDQLKAMSEAINQRINYYDVNSEAYKYLQGKKNLLENGIMKIIKEAHFDEEEFQLHVLFDESQKLRAKIMDKPFKPKDAFISQYNSKQQFKL